MADRRRRADDGASPDLRALVPRGSLQWLRDHPEDRHRQIDGSLVFVDISGFTAMSERLARLGPVGAEEVTDLLNHTFSRLLAVAYEDDGSLLKFGGDALLIQFEGDEHCGRAVHAAWGMRRKLRELQPLRSSAGQVRLRMSVGVHTGAIDHVLVGSSHRELLVVGPAATEVVTMEGAADAGQIMVSDAVVEALGDALATTPAGPGHLLRSAPPPPRHRSQLDARPVPASLAGSLLSATLGAQLSAGVPQAEHRPSVIGFVKVLGIDEHLRIRGDESTAKALEHLVDVVVEACRPDDVCLLATDIDAGGAKFILTAGVPTSQEFDGERMLRALRRIVEREARLPLKVGVHSGPVFAGVVGPPFRNTYTVIGDAVNMAARVMGHAQPGEILATPEVLNRSQALFVLDDVPPFAVKGKKQLVTAYRVGELSGERLRRPRARFRLAGRQDELQRLVAAADAAAAGRGLVVQLVGPAGIGKSRLVDELHERRPELNVVLTACNRHESTTPYHAVGVLLRSLLQLPEVADPRWLARTVARLAPHLRDALPLLGDVIGIDVPDNDSTSDLTAGFRAERAAATAAALLEVLVREPAAIVVEDLHWIDPESRAVFVVLARTALARRRWLLLGTSRRAVALDAGAPEEIIDLSPLGEGAAREMVLAAVEEGLLPLDRAQQLLDKAGGNPFFLQELLVVGGDEELPESVDALMQAQLDQLRPGDRELLGYAALLGSEVDLDLLEATTGVSVAVQRSTFRRLRGFLDPTGEGGFRFRHALVQDGAYKRLPFRRRRELHRAAAAALEARADGVARPDLLALHTYHARDWERARRFSLDAARAASARYANLTAAEHYRHALESGRHVRGLPDAEVSAVWEQLGDALLLACSYDDAVSAYRQARRLADPPRQVHLCLQIGQVRERQGRFREALHWYSRALRLDEGIGTGEAARLLLEAAIVRNRQGRPLDALAFAQRAAAVATDVGARARVHYVRAWAAMLQGEDAADDQRRTLELFESAGDLIGQGLAYNIISMAAYYRGDWDEAADAYGRAAAVRRRVGDEVGTAAMTGNLGELLSDQGHFDRARPLLEECRAVCAAAGFLSSRWFATMTLGRLDARLGRFEDAELQLKEALAGIDALGMGGLRYDCHRCLAELCLFRGDVTAVLDWADRLDAEASFGSASLRAVGQRLYTSVLVEQGSPEAADAAERLLELLDPGAHDYDTGLALVAAGAALELAGDLRARAASDRARSILGRLGVVVPGELLVFGPASVRAERAAAGPATATA